MTPPYSSTQTAVPTFVHRQRDHLYETLSPGLDDELRARLHRGLHQVSLFWRPQDGDERDLEAFVLQHFIRQPAELDATFRRLEVAFEAVFGHLTEISHALRRHTDLEVGPLLPIDDVLSAYSPGAHLIEDFFRNKLAFIVLLNFPLTSLDERLEEGLTWSRQQWAEARLASIFEQRVPAQVVQEIVTAAARADQYIAGYNIWTHHLLSEDGQRLFPAGQRMISHWNLRDELKACYSEPTRLPRQRIIARVMEHIVCQTIPRTVIDNPSVDWAPFSNQVWPSTVSDSSHQVPHELDISPAREPDTRYQHLLNVFHAVRLEDPHTPHTPSLMARRFQVDREMPEERVRAILEEVISSPLMARVARLITQRLGRPLEPFDLWYNGFRSRGHYSEEALDTLVRARYEDLDAFTRGLPALLEQLGFTPDKARFLSDRIVVEPARGAGHASGAERRGERSRLRTRVGQGGMDYKAFNIAVHELGHNVEQTFSLYGIDHYALRGVPNTAFTEAIAFLFQSHDLKLLGLDRPSDDSRALTVLNDYWGTVEISAVALLDMAVWHWMYEHPQATAEALRDAVIQHARDLWNTHFAPVYGDRDSVLLGIYSHMIDSMLYLPDYPIGHLIAFQIEEQITKAGDLGAEVERITRLGRLTPDIWMQQATGERVSAGPMLRAVERALDRIEGMVAA